jgi:hypothetical protein
MKVELTEKIKEVLRDPAARKQLQSALVGDQNPNVITVGDKIYELVPLSTAEFL